MPSSAEELRQLLASTPEGPRLRRERPVSVDERRPSSFDRSEARLAEVTARAAMRHRTGRPDRDSEGHHGETTGLRDGETTGPRATSTLQRAWIDPEETPFEPVARPGSPMAARLISWIVVIGFCCGLGWLILPELDLRLTNLDSVELRNGVLTAQPVPLSPLRPAIVNELYVDASSLPDGVLPEGSPVALLESAGVDGVDLREMRIPFDARFVSVDTLVGGVVMPGTPVATIYDPTKMYVIVSVVPDTLNSLRRGMRAELHSDLIDGFIGGEVISAVPLLGTDHEPTTADLVNIRIKPDAGSVADLVPGIRFDASIDLTSAPPGAQPLIFTYAGHVDVSGAPADVFGDEDFQGND